MNPKLWLVFRIHFSRVKSVHEICCFSFDVFGYFFFSFDLSRIMIFNYSLNGQIKKNKKKRGERKKEEERWMQL